MKWVLIALAVIAGVALLLWIIGSLLPKGHVARCRARLAKPADEVFGTISDFEHVHEWSSEIDRMERQPDRDGREVWLTVGKWGKMPTEVEVREPPRRLVTRIVPDNAAFSGAWTYEVEPDGAGSTLTITEEGEVSNPFFRCMMVFHDNHATIKKYLRDLGARLGVDVDPVELP